MFIFHIQKCFTTIDYEIMEREGPLLFEQSPVELKIQKILNNFSLVSDS